MAFNNYLEDENDKPYFTTNSLAYYYDKMEGFAKAVEGSAKTLNLTKEEIEQRIALRLAEWDKNLESFDGSVEKLLTEWVDDGTLTHVIDSTLIDQRLAPVAQQLAEKIGGTTKAEPEDLSERTLALVTGQGTINLESIPQNKSVTAEKTTFAKSGKNLWDGKIVENVSLSGAVPSGTYGTLDGARTVIKQVAKGSNVVVSRIAGSSDRFRLAVCAGPPAAGKPMRYILANDVGSTITTTLQGDEDHLFIYVSSVKTGFPQEFMIELGSVKTAYESHEVVKINLTKDSYDTSELIANKNDVLETRHFKKKSVTPEIATFVNPGKNLFDGVYTVDRSLSGSTSADGMYTASTSKAVSVVYKGVPGESYTFSRDVGSTTRFRLATFKTLPNVGDSVSRYILANDVGSTIPVTLNSDENYIVCFVSLNEDYKKPENFMIEKGLKKTEYESPNKVTMDFSSVQDFGIEKKDFYFTDIIQSNYSNTKTYISDNGSDVLELYAFYDAMMSDYPQYITKTLMGNDISGLPIYVYDFKPQNPQLNVELQDFKYPKIIYNCGTHGFEKAALWSAAKFFDDLCRNWRTDSLLNALRWNVHFRVIPCLNPSGYNLNTRKNGNGVDLNRNFTDGWGGGDTDPTSNYYRGSAPATEKEVQLMEQFIDDNKDAVFFVDHHNSGGWESQGHVIWGSANTENVRNMISGFLNFMESKAKKDFSYIDENANLRYFSIPLGGGVSYAAHSAGIKSMLLETAVQFESVADTQKFNTESVGNLLLSVLKSYS